MSYIKIFLVAVFILSALPSAFAENVTLTTYYPAPSGNYAEMTSNTLTVKTKLIFDAATPIVAGISGTLFYLEPSAAAAYAFNGDGLVVASDGSIGIKKTPGGTVELDVNGDIAATTLTTAGNITTTAGGTLTVAGASSLQGLTATAISASSLATSGNIVATGQITGATLTVGAILPDGGGVVNIPSATEITGTLTLLGAADLNVGEALVGGIVHARTYLHWSDERLKDDIVPITGAIQKVQGMNGVYFKYKGKDEKKIGLIAQDVEKVVPEVVVTDKDGMKSVDYSSLIAVLIQAVKEQQVIIEDLKATIERNSLGR
jgi:hypothetical protein